MKKGSDIKLLLTEQLYRFIYNFIEPERLRQEHRWPHPRKGWLEPRTEPGSGIRFLDFYSIEGIEFALEQYGIYQKIRRQGFDELRLELRRASEGYDVLKLFASNCEPPLVELVAQVGELGYAARKFVPEQGRRFLHVRWLRMQNPLKKPEPEKPLLPGQDYPGLGIGREMMALLQMICVRLELDGIVVLPERLHNAALYFRRFRFLDPKLQGMLTAVLRDCRKHKLAEVAWAVEAGGLIDARTGKPLRWLPAEQVLARTGPALEWLESAEYRRQALEEMESCRFVLSSGDLALEEALRTSPGGGVKT